ncbi:hypothetical protein RB213_000638 [Colletotrichum asianum]
MCILNEGVLLGIQDACSFGEGFNPWG